ncbi:ferredoxin [candidate division KSB3 bacterium]|uniref:Ferredoxin n=1 Tax=candidate division KSB3 bacterium TaxID=2044937 RepID=A0A2G6E8E9_9BACT|nr:MAG: ferredoxin [candidate division KSB3 bacterium]PIE30423.1 MAG: ferredoxin [candidate division KSB3 bacterium]
MDLVSLHIDDSAVQVPKGTTVLEAAGLLDISIPNLCMHPGLRAQGFCRICVVEVAGYDQLQPACVLQAENGMCVHTSTKKVVRSRRMSLEMIIAQHPMRCLTCARNGTCRLQELARQFGIQSSRFFRRDAALDEETSVHLPRSVDENSPAISHDPSMCILCGLCVEACRNLQHVDVIDFAYRGVARKIEAAFGQNLGQVECTACGQCVQVCPSNAFYEKQEGRSVLHALQDPDIHVVALLSPMTAVSLGEEFECSAGRQLSPQLIASLKALGFNKVFDVAVGADLLIMEEAYQLLNRFKSGQLLPMISSSSPAWIKYAEHFYPDMLPLLSPCKSPVQVLASLLKSYYAQQHSLAPEQIFSVSISPCTAEKFERTRPESTFNGHATLDACLTTKELASLLRGNLGEHFVAAEAQSFDAPFDRASGAGMLFCGAGGMLEGIMRTFFELYTGKRLKKPEFPTMRSPGGFKEISLKLGDQSFSAAIVHGTGTVRRLLEKITKEKKQYHYIEIKGCPQGCARGGGQPLPWDEETILKRTQALYDLDAAQTIRKAHENPTVKELYRQVLKKPGSPRSKKLLHTSYTQRQRYL